MHCRVHFFDNCESLGLCFWGNRIVLPRQIMYIFDLILKIRKWMLKIYFLTLLRCTQTNSIYKDEFFISLVYYEIVYITFFTIKSRYKFVSKIAFFTLFHREINVYTCVPLTNHLLRCIFSPLHMMFRYSYFQATSKRDFQHILHRVCAV